MGLYLIGSLSDSGTTSKSTGRGIGSTGASGSGQSYGLSLTHGGEGAGIVVVDGQSTGFGEDAFKVPRSSARENVSLTSEEVCGSSSRGERTGRSSAQNGKKGGSCEVHFKRWIDVVRGWIDGSRC